MVDIPLNTYIHLQNNIFNQTIRQKDANMDSFIKVLLSTENHRLELLPAN